MHDYPTEVCKGVARTKEQSQPRVRNLLLRMVSTTDEFRRTDTRATHPGQENYSPPKARIHLRRLVFSTKLFPCSRAADHTFVTVSNTSAEILSRFKAFFSLWRCPQGIFLFFRGSAASSRGSAASSRGSAASSRGRG